jgi:lysophospholipase L1-like esterase
MKRCLYGLVILGGFALLFFCATSAEADFTIMPLGASITSGSGGTNGGYRDRLYSDLRDAGLSFTFVGTSTENPSRLLTQASQTHHEGHPGYRIDQVANNLDGNDGSSGNNGGSWFHNPSPPNIILLEAGRNDIAQNFQTSTMAQRMDKLVGQIFADSPTSILLLSSSVPTGFNPTMNQLLQAYNTQIRDVIVPKYQSLGDNVIFVDQYANFVDAKGNIIHVSGSDNYHPDTTGYNLMADTWAAALLQAAPVPELSTLLLLGIGSIGLLGYAWRRHLRTA